MTTPGKGGRPRKPGNLRVLDGDKPDRFNHDEPVPGQSDVRPPAWLAEAARLADSGRETALDLWNAVSPDLIRKGVLTPWDVDEFAIWCDAVVSQRAAALEVARHGLMVEGALGNQVKNPACQLARDYADTVVKLGARFGMSPSDRAGLKIEKEPSGAGAERYLS